MKSLKSIAAILVLTGTVGLLLNEFLFQWGKSATLTFAVTNILGFIFWVIAYFLDQKIETRNTT